MSPWSFTPPKTLRDVPTVIPGDHPALISPATDDHPTYEVSYEVLTQNIEAVAKRLIPLLSQDGRPEQVVALAMPNTLVFPIGFLATAWAGAATAPLNPDYKQEEFAFYLEDNNVDILLVSIEGNPAAEAAAQSLNIPIYRLTYNPSTTSSSLTWVSGPKVEGAAEGTLPSAPPTDKPVMYMHTSGTTSRPKRVRLTHGNLATSLGNIQRTYELSPEDRTLLVMPLFHVHGLIAGLLTTLASGGSIIVHGKFAASKFWKHIVTHKATWYTAVPTMHQILLMRAETDYPKDNRPPLRFIRSCSASLAASVLERLETTFHAPVLEAYAMTENAHQMTSNPLPKVGPRKPGSVGKATGVQLAILDDDFKTLPAGKIGEVCLKGPSVTPGYVNNPSANEVGFAGGWFHTGDQGVLDEEGYLTLTGRIKELIIRGGEKISPLEVDAVLLSHPLVGEAVCFAAPDPKYGEEVNAVVTVKPGATLTEEDVLAHCRTSLADFKLPKKLYIAENVPRTATGKIQRRIVAEHFLKAGDSSSSSTTTKPPAATKATDGYLLVAKALKAAGVDYMFGVVGIPVTRLGATAQEAGIRFISFRNEQAASYAASVAGYLTGRPAALLTVSGPGVIHGLPGLANAGINAWPMLMLSGSTARNNLGKGGGFQELDQISATDRHAKGSFRINDILGIPAAVKEAVQLSLKGRPGGVYLDLPADVLHSTIGDVEETDALNHVKAILSTLDSLQDPPGGLKSEELATAIDLLKGAKKPLLVFGKGAAYARAEEEIRGLVTATGIPFLATPMGKGVVPDDHPLSAAAARSLVLKEADVVLVVGARLNWILHFGEPPRWSPTTKFILVDVTQDIEANEEKRFHLTAHAKVAVKALAQGLGGWKVDSKGEWVGTIQAKVAKNAKSMAARLEKVVIPLDYHTTYAVILRKLAALKGPQPIIVSEGANTMDIGRSLLNISEPRTRMDAGAWGTMGVGLGYAIAAATVYGSDRLVIAIEGDSAFGFSGMEIETMVRYKLRVVTLVFNNNGIYGGKYECEPSSAFPKDPAPTAFVPNIRYDQMMTAVGGLGLFASNPEELDQVLEQAFKNTKGPSLINIAIDPTAGTESGSLTDHN